MIGERVAEARVLDLFAGSGALGLEAWSRGAASVTFVENHRRGMQNLRSNVEALVPVEHHDDFRYQVADVLAALRRLSSGGTAGGGFDLIFADPPYYENWLERTLPVIDETKILAEGGWLLFEQHRREVVPEVVGWTLEKDKLYGTTRVLIFRFNDAPSGGRRPATPNPE